MAAINSFAMSSPPVSYKPFCYQLCPYLESC